MLECVHFALRREIQGEGFNLGRTGLGTKQNQVFRELLRFDRYRAARKAMERVGSAQPNETDLASFSGLRGYKPGYKGVGGWPSADDIRSSVVASMAAR
jgi:hypothetical protein